MMALNPLRSKSSPKLISQKTKTTGSTAMQKVFAFLKEQMRTVLGAAIVALVGALGFWLTPLKEIVLQQLYPERAEVSISTDRNSISSGQRVQIEIKITQLSAFPVSKGVARLDFDPELLTLSPDSTQSINTGEINGATAQHFVLLAREGKLGKTELRATLETKFNAYKSARLTVELVPRREVSAPYIEQHGSQAINLSGEWHIEVGGVHGEMQIMQDSKNNITGAYGLENMPKPPSFIVNGYKDGTSFKVFFHRDKEGTRRWRVDANFAMNPSDKRFVEIKGCAFSIIKDPTVSEDSAAEAGDKDSPCAHPRNYVGWKGLGASTFYATAQMQR